ncbi:hypothetical protein [Amycolatopsis sp. lyj-109]|uniref:hypothetical protein n=1 Tax=Amycolatopsis sp. lyj-109 TaxID=2789287 RepID=UPI00397C751E
MEGLSVRALADRHGVHRRTVRQALESAVPPPRKTPARSTPLTDPLRAAMDEMPRADLDAPRKQRHTAHRIWERLLDEVSQPLSQEFGFTTVQDIDRLARAVHMSSAEREVVDTKHRRHCRELRLRRLDVTASDRRDLALVVELHFPGGREMDADTVNMSIAGAEAFAFVDNQAISSRSRTFTCRGPCRSSLANCMASPVQRGVHGR